MTSNLSFFTTYYNFIMTTTYRNNKLSSQTRYEEIPLLSEDGVLLPLRLQFYYII